MKTVEAMGQGAAREAGGHGEPVTGTRAAGKHYVRGTVTIGRPVEEVFAFAGHYENDPLWRADVAEMHQDPPGEPRVGARTREVMRVLGRPQVTTAEVRAYERNRRTAFRSLEGSVSVEGHRLFEPADERTTRFTYELALIPAGRLQSALMIPVSYLLRRGLARDLATLKATLERV